MTVEPPADPRARLRASDSDRELVVDQLRTYLAEGRLTVDEFEDRSSRTWASKTYGELWDVTHDLPAPKRSGPPVRERPDPHPAHRPSSHHRHGRREVTSLWLMKLVVINLFLIAIWAAGGGGYFWPIWPILSCGLVVGLRAVNQGRRPT